MGNQGKFWTLDGSIRFDQWWQINGGDRRCSIRRKSD
jgi:hypothetical protein